MPFSIVPKIPAIKENIIAQGYTKEFPVKALRIAIIRETGLTSDKAIAGTINIMKELNEMYQRGDVFCFRPEGVTPVMEEPEKEKTAEESAKNTAENLKKIHEIENAEPSGS